MLLVAMVARLFPVFIVLVSKGITGQQYILKSDSPNLDDNEVCPRNIELTCMGIRVGIVYWNATTIDGREHVLASHSGGQGEHYDIQSNFTGISFNMTPSFVFYPEDGSLFDVNATIDINLSSVVKQNIIGFSCGSTIHMLSSNLYSTNVTVIGQPPPPSITGCCLPSTSISSDPIICSVVSKTQISFSWSSQYSNKYHVQRYQVEYDDRLVGRCLSGHFASPNQTCNFSGLNGRTEYTFSISALNCGDQESPTTNLTISLASLSDSVDLQGVTITPSYSSNHQLIAILVQWNYLESKCPGLDIGYTISLKNSSNFIIENSTVFCNEVDICKKTLLVSSDYKYDIYIVEVSAYYNFDPNTNISYTSETIGRVSPNISVEFLSCTVKCYSNSSGTCEIQYIQNTTILLYGSVNRTVNSDDILAPPDLGTGMVYYNAIFNIGGNTFMLQNSSMIQYENKWTNKVWAALIVGLIFIILNLLIPIVFCVCWKCKRGDLVKRYAIIILIPSLLLLLPLSIWIAGLVEINKAGNCENVGQPQDILIAASVISISSFFMHLSISSFVFFYCVLTNGNVCKSIGLACLIVILVFCLLLFILCLPLFIICLMILIILFICYCWWLWNVVINCLKKYSQKD